MFTTVFDISFGEAFDNSNNALPASLNITSSTASSSGRNPYIIDTHLGFYEKNKAQQLFSLQSSEIITSSDIIDISNSYTKRKVGALPTIYDISKGPHSGPDANITTITTETALVENLRLQETQKLDTNLILGISGNSLIAGPNNESRYDVYYTETKDLDLSGNNYNGLKIPVGLLPNNTSGYPVGALFYDSRTNTLNINTGAVTWQRI